jgi:copper chaperone
MIFEVENIKCGGCANGIRQKLTALDAVDEVNVDVESGQVDVVSAAESDALKSTIRTTLAGMGYPEKGSVEGLSSVKAKATSYVSCAIGKMSAE